MSRIPVCSACLTLPQPLEAECFCASCGTPFVESYPLDQQGVCQPCRENAVHFDAAYSFGSYDHPLQDLIHLFKYAKIESLAEPLGRLLLRALPRGVEFDMVLAMPMHWRKRWDRGFNQAELLAAPVARKLGLKVSGSLRRTRHTQAQAGLSEAERKTNLKGAFAVRNPAQIAQKRILLVDDVFTTGATLRAATEALKSAGAAHVSVLTLARVGHRSKQDFASHSSEIGRHPTKAVELTEAS